MERQELETIAKELERTRGRLREVRDGFGTTLSDRLIIMEINKAMERLEAAEKEAMFMARGPVMPSYLVKDETDEGTPWPPFTPDASDAMLGSDED